MEQLHVGNIVTHLPETCEGSTVPIEIRENESSTALFTHCSGLDGKHANPDIRYNIDIAGMGKFLAIYQYKEWWTRPYFGTNTGEIPDRTQLLILDAGSCYLVFLAICGSITRSDISGREDGITVTVGSNLDKMPAEDDLSLVVSSGKDLYRCLAGMFEYAAGLLGHNSMLRCNKEFPEIFDGFGWCTWNAFYRDVSEAGILKKMDEFHEKGIPVQWVLIDDGWMNSDPEKEILSSLQADKAKFPGGLKHCVRILKEKYHVKYVGVWHAVTGYWNGITKDSPAEKGLQDTLITLSDGKIVPAPEAGRAFRFFNTWHEFLRNECGIDFVKVDGQSNISRFYKGCASYGEASEEIQKGLNASAAMTFVNMIINCMGMGSEDVWHRPSSSLSRNSDDFFPDVSYNYREHALQNVYNSLWTGWLYFGDWDMFFSSRSGSLQHSILRAVSGGPIYTSDAVGESDPDLISKLVMDDGSIARCDEPGLPVPECIFNDPVKTASPLIVQNHLGDAVFLALFNLYEGLEAENAILSDGTSPLLKGKQWIAYRYGTRETFPLSNTENAEVSLEAEGADIIELVPVSGEQHIAVIGIIEKYLPIGGVSIIKRTSDRAELKARTQGTLAIWTDRPIERISADGHEILWDKGNNGMIYLEVSADELIKISV